MRERDVDRLCRASRLEDGARVVELVLPEVDPDRRDRYRDDGDSGDRLRGAGELLQVDRRDEPVERERLLPRANRRGIVLARPAQSMRELRIMAR